MDEGSSVRVAVRVRHSTPHPYTENARARERERERERVSVLSFAEELPQPFVSEMYEEGSAATGVGGRARAS